MNRAAHFGGRAGGFKAGRAAADDHDVARFPHLLFSIDLPGVHLRVHRAADRAVQLDAVAGAANVAADAFAQLVLTALGHLACPARLGDQPAAHAHEVGVASREDLLGHLRVADVAGGDGGLAETLAHGPREERAPAVGQAAGVDLVVDGVVQPARHVDDVDLLDEVFQQLKRVVERVAAGHALVGGQAEDDGEVLADLLAHGVEHHAREAGAVLWAAAEFVGAVVHRGGEELAQQVAVAAVHLDGVEAGDLRAARCLAVLAGDGFQLLARERARRGAAGFRREIRRGNGLHARAAFHGRRAGVVDLHRDAGAVAVQRFGELVEARDVAVVVDAQLRGAVGAGRPADVGVLHDDQPRAAGRALLVVADVAQAHLAVLAGVVGAHRRH